MNSHTGLNTPDVWKNYIDKEIKKIINNKKQLK